MPVWIGLLVVALNAGLCLHRYPAGLAVFAALSLTMPHTALGEAAVSYEILAFVPIAAIYLLKNRPSQVEPVYMLLFGYTVMLGLSTIVSLLYKNGVLEAISLLGIIRVTLLALIISQQLSQAHILRIFGFGTFVNTVLVAIQLRVPESVQVFHQLYFKATATPLDSYMELGFMPRSTGSFASPVALAAFMMMATTLCAMRLLRREGSFFDVLVLIGSVFCGLMAASKLYLIGTPLLLSVGILLMPFLARRRPTDRIELVKNLAVYPLFFGLAACGYALIERLSEDNPFLKYAFDFLFKPGESLATRFDQADGALNDMIAVILDNIVIGVGKTTLRNEFVGDSAYLLSMHDTGLVGTGALVVVLVVLVVRGVRTRDLAALMALVALLVAGIATTLVLSLMGVLVMTYVSRSEPPAPGHEAAAP